MLKIRPIARKLATTTGAEIAEAALVLPLVFMLLLGIVWFGRAFNIYCTMQQAAQQGALAAARASCAMCGDTTATSAVTGAVLAVMQSSNLEPGQIQLPPSAPNCAPGQICIACPSPPAPSTGSCSSASNIYICQNVQLNPATGSAQPAQCGSVVSFQYPFQFYLPGTSLNLSRIVLSAQAQSRMEN
ncbi:MAG: TadE family protein [Terriglobales bacterium]